MSNIEWTKATQEGFYIKSEKGLPKLVHLSKRFGIDGLHVRTKGGLQPYDGSLVFGPVPNPPAEFADGR